MKTTEKAAKRVAKDNAKFRRMTDAEKRVAIAQDVIAWVKAGALKPLAGTYVDPTMDFVEIRAHGEETQLRDVKLGSCHVCAIGGMFLAKAVRFDEVTVGSFFEYDEHAHLTDFFSEEQLGLIEFAFEGYGSGPFGIGDYDSEEAAGARKLHKRYRSDRGRLLAIMQNIVDNAGEFRPESP